MAAELKSGDRIFISDRNHPWTGRAGEVISFVSQTFGLLGWTGWLVELDGNCGKTYVKPQQVTKA